MDIIVYFILGIIVGLLSAYYMWATREEKIEKTIKFNQKIFSTQKLDNTMETVVNRIEEKMQNFKRELTEDEKNDIIIECYKEKFSNYIGNK